MRPALNFNSMLELMQEWTKPNSAKFCKVSSVELQPLLWVRIEMAKGIRNVGTVGIPLVDLVKNICHYKGESNRLRHR